MSMLTRFLLYGALGCLMEVFWTGLASLRRKDFKLSARTSIWMFFIYGLAVFLEPVFRLLHGFPLVFRGAFYAGCIFLVEYVTGHLLNFAKIRPWDYNGCRFNLQGVIRLDYAPAWFVAGLIFERVYVTIMQLL